MLYVLDPELAKDKSHQFIEVFAIELIQDRHILYQGQDMAIP